jgi:hypothetical protein
MGHLVADLYKVIRMLISVPICSAFPAAEPPNSRQNAREKLTRLTKQQFSELATDVYDELSRRTANAKDGQSYNFFSRSFVCRLVQSTG